MVIGFSDYFEKKYMLLDNNIIYASIVWNKEKFE